MVLKKSGRDLDHKDELRQTRQIIILRFIFFRDQVFTVCKVLDAIEEGEEFDDVTGIAIEPPEVRAETVEELDPGSASMLTGL